MKICQLFSPEEFISSYLITDSEGNGLLVNACQIQDSFIKSLTSCRLSHVVLTSQKDLLHPGLKVLEKIFPIPVSFGESIKSPIEVKTIASNSEESIIQIGEWVFCSSRDAATAFYKAIPQDLPILCAKGPITSKSELEALSQIQRT